MTFVKSLSASGVSPESSWRKTGTLGVPKGLPLLVSRKDQMLRRRVRKLMGVSLISST